MKEEKNNQIYVPVVSKTEKTLMPCRSARSRQLIEKGKAIKQWRGGLFYIKLTEREEGETQIISCGIDPGSKKEAMTVRSEKKTLLNIQLDAVTYMKDRVLTRSQMRRVRRFRNTPYRKCRSIRKRKKNFVAPSTKARYDWKLKILRILKKLYPIKVFVYEDIKARCLKGKENRNWNTAFSPLQVGKKYFLKELNTLGEVIVKQGYETMESRKELGLPKDKKKLSNSFFAHCVDSWILAGFGLPKLVTLLDNKRMLFIKKVAFHKRQLHRMKANKFGKRPRFGGTVSFGMSRGSIVKHPEQGIGRVGGFLTNSLRVGFHALSNYKRGRNLKILSTQLIRLANCNWTWRYSI